MSSRARRPLAAALKGAEQIGFTIMSLTVSLIAVLIPLLFMGDITGRLFREFAVTLERHDPDLRRRLAHPHADAVREAPAGTGTTSEQSRFYKASERMFEKTIAFYERTLDWVLEHRGLTLGRRGGTLVADRRSLYVVIPKGFFPVQDTGEIQGVSEADQSVSFAEMARTAAAARRDHPRGSRRSRACPRSSASTAPTRRSTAAGSRSILSP